MNSSRRWCSMTRFLSITWLRWLPCVNSFYQLLLHYFQRKFNSCLFLLVQGYWSHILWHWLCLQILRAGDIKPLPVLWHEDNSRRHQARERWEPILEFVSLVTGVTLFSYPCLLLKNITTIASQNYLNLMFNAVILLLYVDFFLKKSSILEEIFMWKI